MPNALSAATTERIAAVFDRSIRRAADVAWFEDAAQELTTALREAFPDSIALARAYLTVPYSALPTTNMKWVEGLAESKGVLSEMTERTPVISLVASSGRESAWNDRRASQGHVGIPMVSASFIDAIPMMSRLMASLGGDLAWIDAADSSLIASRLGTVTGTFHVRDAVTQRDTKGRLVIPATDFVAEHGIKTVFGIGGAFATGQLLVVLVFCTEDISLETVRLLQTPFLHFKSAVVPLLGRVFREGRGTLSPTAGAPASSSATTTAQTSDELALLNKAYLELEARLEERTNALKLILDSAGDAFVLLNFDGSIAGDLTTTSRTWFGEPSGGRHAQAGPYLFGEGSREALNFQAGLGQIGEQILPFDLSADGMPQTLHRDGRHFELSYREVFERGRFVRVLLTIRDVTARIAAAEAERRTREVSAMIALILRDRRGFEMYLEESRRSIEQVCSSESMAAVLRLLHTLKGTSAVCGLETFASFIHQLEEQVLDSGEALTSEMAAQLHASWERSIETISALVEIRPQNMVEITVNEHEDVLNRLERAVDQTTALQIALSMREWRLERAGVRLGRLAREAERLANRMGKQLDVIVDDGGVRISPEHGAAFWSSLVHVIRNAVDHGIESPEDRVAAGKSAQGEIRLTSRRSETNGELLITIADDGRGVDWDIVRGHAKDSSGELEEVLFRDGFSTRESVDETSGRGIGLSAVRSACMTIGATVDVESSIRGRGTMFRFHVPPMSSSSSSPAP